MIWFIYLIDVNLQLYHGLVCLGHLTDIDSKVFEMLFQKWIGHHIVLGVAEDVGLDITVGPDGDSTKLDRQGVPGLGIVVHGVIVAPGTVKELPAAVDCAVRKVQPQVLTGDKLMKL